MWNNIKIGWLNINNQGQEICHLSAKVGVWSALTFFYSRCNFRAEIQSQTWKMCCLPNMTNTKDGLEKVCWYSVCTVLAGTMLHLMNYTIHASHGIHQTSVESRSTVKVIRGSVFLKIWMWNLFLFSFYFFKIYCLFLFIFIGGNLCDFIWMVILSCSSQALSGWLLNLDFSVEVPFCPLALVFWQCVTVLTIQLEFHLKLVCMNIIPQTRQHVSVETGSIQISFHASLTSVT